MKATQKNLLFLAMVFAGCLITANVVAAKIWFSQLSIGTMPIMCTVGAFSYAITFLITDIVSEVWNKDMTQKFIQGGFIAQIVSTILVVIFRYLPALDAGVQDAYVVILGQNWLFVLGSMIAYWVSKSWDVYIFHAIRNWYLKSHESTKGGRWMWNKTATITAQLLDTAIFATIPFGFGFGYLWTAEGRIALLGIIVTQCVVKWLLAALDTPIFYMLTKVRSRKEIENG